MQNKNVMESFIGVYGFTNLEQLELVLKDVEISVPVYFGIKIDDTNMGRRNRWRQARLSMWDDLVAEHVGIKSFIYLQSHEESELIADLEFIFESCKRIPEMLILCPDELSSGTLHFIRESYPNILIGLDVKELDFTVGRKAEFWAPKVVAQFSGIVDFYYVDRENDSLITYGLERIGEDLDQLTWLGMEGPFLISGGLQDENVDRLSTVLDERSQLSILAGCALCDDYGDLEARRVNRFLRKAVSLFREKE